MSSNKVKSEKNRKTKKRIQLKAVNKKAEENLAKMKTTKDFLGCHGSPPDLNLKVDRGAYFDAWREQWDAFALVTNLYSYPAEVQVNVLKRSFSRKTAETVSKLRLSRAEESGAEGVGQECPREASTSQPNTSQIDS